MKQAWLKRWVVLLALIVGLGFSQTATADVLKEILDRGELRVAVPIDSPPFNFVDKKGVRAGICVEFVNMMAKSMGVTATFTDFEFQDQIPALLEGEVDIIAADLTATLERALKFSFTDPFYLAGTVVFTRSDRYFKAIKDANKEIVTVAVLKGTTGERDAKLFLPNAKRKAIKGGAAQLIRAVQKKQADVGITDETALTGALAKSKKSKIKILPGLLSHEPLCFWVRHEDEILRRWMNLFFQLARGDGSYEKMVGYWLKSTAWAKDH
jgi:polar amino acid transport system substrate-binding protein